MMDNKQKNQVMETLALVMQVSISMILPILACTLFGVWIGNKIDVDWIAILGFFIGAAAGVESVYKIVKKYLKNNDKRV
ncbi:MAG: AtpZ/AtpI family protein [Lachnospiraceae bacterium]|nr:AtpZ/AtpI family protein [Lachnospiraceae bacterium]